MHFVRVKQVLVLILINWLDNLLNNNNNNNNNNNIKNNYYNNYYYFSNNSHDNINSKEYLGEVFKSVIEYARTSHMFGCSLYFILDKTLLLVYETFKACCYSYFLLRVPQFFRFNFFLGQI